MIIKSLKVSNSKNNYLYNFEEKTMIFSHENSKGKTTLLRFILYALGYQIPATEGIGDFNKFKFEISINIDDKDRKIFRQNDYVEVLIDDNVYKYTLPIQENELHSTIFGIDNIVILNNLLAVYYIDQEKGWTLLNRGKIIGNIRFNIEEFVAGISEIDINNLLSEKKVLNNELKKYRYFKNVIDINAEFADEDDKLPEYDQYNMNDLIEEQKELELKLRKQKSKRKETEEILRTNKGFAEMIENYGIIINHNGEEFVLTKDKLSDFDRTQELLKIKLNNYKIEEEKIRVQLEKILRVINEKNTLISVDDILETMQKNIESIGIDVSQIDKIIKQLTNKRNNINRQIKDKLSFNNKQLYNFYETIFKYADELGIMDFISDKTPKFVLTNKLKGLSGRVLAQMSYVFKLSYIKAIEQKYGLVLPIIIDSPRTNELSEESTNNMLKILQRDFSHHQIIMASIYSNNVINFNIINLENGLLSDDFKQ